MGNCARGEAARPVEPSSPVPLPDAALAAQLAARTNPGRLLGPVATCDLACYYMRLAPLVA
jgi:hypothetical protein